MKITIAAVGKLKSSSPYAELVALYARRLPWSLEIKEVEEKKMLPPAQLKEREAELLLAAVPANAKIILLDEKGAMLTSAAFAARLSDWQEKGEHTLAFLIGGAAGHGDKAKARADFSLSLSAMTWPHMAARALLVEQLYRSYTVQSGHPYHKE